MQLSAATERRLPSLNAVRSFEAAARHLSFTLAARELSVTQGAVSRMVQALEAELGLALFRRIGRTLELTPAGAAYQPHISQPWRALPQPLVRSGDSNEVVCFASLCCRLLPCVGWCRACTAFNNATRIF